MYINLRYGNAEAIMNYLEKDDKLHLLTNKNSDKVSIIKNKQDNKAIMIRDGREFEVKIDWIEDQTKVQSLWDEFEELGLNYFRSADDLYGVVVTEL